MATIRVEDNDKARIESLGTMLDSHGSVVTKMLDVIYAEPGLVEKVRQMSRPKVTPVQKEETRGRRKKGRAKRGTITPVEAYEKPILAVLLDAPGNKLTTREVLAKIEPLMKDILKEEDHQPLAKTGVTRWRNKSQWWRKIAVDDKLLEGPETAGHGWWKLTTKGIHRGIEIDADKLLPPTEDSFKAELRTTVFGAIREHLRQLKHQPTKTP